MNPAVRRRIVIVAMGLSCGVAFAQQPVLDAKSRELIEAADAALAQARSIAVVQTRHTTLVVKDRNMDASGEHMAILARRPGYFRVAEKGAAGQFTTVSTGREWFCYGQEINAYQKTDVSAFKPDQLFQPPSLANLLTTGRGLTSLWLGKRSLACLFEAATKCTYMGVLNVDGVETHQIGAVCGNLRVVLQLSTGSPPLPVSLAGTAEMERGEDGGKVRLSQSLRFSDWQLEPALADDAFAFTAPEGAQAVPDVRAAQAEAVDTRTRRVRAVPPGKPFPSGEDVHLARDFHAKLKSMSLAYDRAAYEEHGHRGPGWDQAVLEFHAKWNERLFGDSSYALLLDLRDRALYLQSLGCRDALVAYRLANATQYLDGAPAAEPLLAKAWEQLATSTYPASFRFSPLRRYLQVLGATRNQDTAKILGLRQQMVECLGKATGEPAYAGADGARLFLRHFDEYWNELAIYEKGAVLEAMAATPGTNPWIVSFYRGQHEIILAWEVRGSGWADTVSEEAWKGFAAHLATAKENLTAAWRLHPEIPDPARAMITVAMAGHAGESPRAWFDRAIAAQMDLDAAYQNLRYAYERRWFGEPEWILALGIEAANTKRFDTSVPAQYWQCLQTIVAREKESWQDAMARPGAYETLVAVCEGYLSQEGNGSSDRLWHTAKMIAHWAAGKGALAKEELDWLRNQPFLALCTEVGLDPDELMAEIFLMATPQAEAAARGLALLRGGKPEEAVPLLRQTMLAVAETAPQGYAYLGDCIANVPFTAAPGAADTILDAIIEMRRHEVLVQSFVRWMEATGGNVPDAFQARVSQYLGPICWEFMQHAPATDQLTDEEIDSRMATLDAIALAAIPGADAIPADHAKILFETERILARMRLEFCRQIPGNTTKASWPYVRSKVNPVFKAIPRRGRLIDFATEHDNSSRHSYQYAMQEALKTWIQAQGVAIWDAYSYSLPPKLEPLKAIVAPAERVDAVWELLWQSGGSLRLFFCAADCLRQSGDSREAAIVERHIIAYLASLRVPIESTFVWGCYAEEYDYVPGYEQRVLDCASMTYRGSSADPETRLHEANAALRVNDLGAAIGAMVSCRRMKPSTMWITVLGERYHGTEEAVGPILRAIAHHPHATPDTLSLLAQLFPDRMAEMQAADAPQ